MMGLTPVFTMRVWGRSASNRRLKELGVDMRPEPFADIEVDTRDEEPFSITVYHNGLLYIPQKMLTAGVHSPGKHPPGKDLAEP